MCRILKKNEKSRVEVHTVAALIITHRYEVSSRQRSIMIG